MAETSCSQLLLIELLHMYVYAQDQCTSYGEHTQQLPRTTAHRQCTHSLPRARAVLEVHP